MKEDVIIIGGGPCGLSTAIELKDKGFDPLVIEKENIVHSIHRYPTHQQFFSTSQKLEIGHVPFIIEERKPKRNQALAYYREVVRLKKPRVQPFEAVKDVERLDDHTFTVSTDKAHYQAKYVVIATGYYDHPNYMNIPGESLDKVFHYFKEAHPFFDQDVVVIGGKNSAVDATLELEKTGARVTVIYRGEDYSSSVKPWILPEFQSLMKHEKAHMVFNASVTRIDEHSVTYEVGGEEKVIKNDFVFAMTGYHPNHTFLQTVGVNIDADSGKPYVSGETMETNITGVFIAGVIAAGNNANEIFIENGRHHGEMIAKEIQHRCQPAPVTI